jgi:putative transposase
MYLQLLRQYCGRHAVQVVGYCLMNNHVHLLAVPHAASGLAKGLGRAHADYSRWLNMKRGETGHVWQNRFYSCPLDERHQWEALRYVELNPVRAGLVREAADWHWSSAAAHMTGVDRTGILDLTDWSRRWNNEAWRDALDQGIEDADLLERIRAATRTGRPAAGDDFVRQLEAGTLRMLRPRRRGPKARAAARGSQLELGVS